MNVTAPPRPYLPRNTSIPVVAAPRVLHKSPCRFLRHAERPSDCCQNHNCRLFGVSIQINAFVDMPCPPLPAQTAFYLRDSDTLALCHGRAPSALCKASRDCQRKFTCCVRSDSTTIRCCHAPSTYHQPHSHVRTVKNTQVYCVIYRRSSHEATSSARCQAWSTVTCVPMYTDILYTYLEYVHRHILIST